MVFTLPYKIPSHEQIGYNISLQLFVAKKDKQEKLFLKLIYVLLMVWCIADADMIYCLHMKHRNVQTISYGYKISYQLLSIFGYGT